jgi:hypothetical protein
MSKRKKQGQQPSLSAVIEEKTIELKELKAREKQGFTDFYNAHKKDEDVLNEVYTKLRSVNLVDCNGSNGSNGNDVNSKSKSKSSNSSKPKPALSVPTQLVKLVLRRRYAASPDTE